MSIIHFVGQIFFPCGCDLFIFTVLHFCNSKPLRLYTCDIYIFYHCSVWKAVFPCSFSLKRKFNRTTQFPFHIERFFYVGMWGMMGWLQRKPVKPVWIAAEWILIGLAMIKPPGLKRSCCCTTGLYFKGSCIINHQCK